MDELQLRSLREASDEGGAQSGAIGVVGLRAAFATTNQSETFDDDEEMKHEQLASIALGRFHAARQYPHGGLALSGRVPGCKLQLQASDAVRADARARQVRRLLHGRSSGRAEHAGASAEAKRHRHFIRSADVAAGARRAD